MIEIVVLKSFLVDGTCAQPGDRVRVTPAEARDLFARERAALWVEPAAVIPELDDLTDEELLDLAAEYQLKPPKKADRTALLELIRAHEAAAAGAT